ncbi:fimbria/pilus periplasmic chaperone [Klebsiella aerogenes]|uniref:fimbria/pilus periplasmic chaperone n=1 Tax=Klebsiella aerogenes TaxID=548 RepID=UPI000DA165B8|nr:fimbria/pilus periplasmic chaperone [Klebsiella aerogenes]HCB2860474.1 fimbria/pilus periplasmic chaperone [Klebsiella aerogenes]HCB2865819.1 fimbria/pilus periplasmic chaperone [Klebsiella aerogenes]HCB2881708.1 fimbria/pilus periplasmic chaperone [Klebsiella aerogenes]HCB3346446.1 fimbria/pilus periplasmic chaperone [Klebsiella aerogenes]HCM1812542.1 fimbria/pilus periplasmic chaperone [Klebsiella aerogenes]
MKMKTLTVVSAVVVGGLSAQMAHAAVALDRTRVIYNGADKSMSLNIENKNKSLPYLAQSWLEDANGQKVTSPLTALPPIQRLEPGAKSQVKLQSVPAAAHLLAQDKETLFYFNLREIPPKSNKPNTLQIALQTRVKLFYRPEALAVDTSDKPFQESLTLTRTGDGYTVKNPTGYYVTLINATKGVNAPAAKDFKPVMVAPKSEASLGVNANEVGDAPVLTYINDFGGRPKLVFSCSGSTCNVARAEKG